jgi:hypothetical protein
VPETHDVHQIKSRLENVMRLLRELMHYHGENQASYDAFGQGSLGIAEQLFESDFHKIQDG